MTDAPRSLTVSSSAFGAGAPIPSEHTCDGDDVAPPLEVRGVPPETRALALILDDPDAPDGTFTHWTFWDLPPDRTSLPAGADVGALGATDGTTDFDRTGYGGPCPPRGVHRYFVRVYALRAPLGLPHGASRAELEEAMAGKVLATGETMGTYERSR